MKLITFRHDDRTAPGLLISGERLLDLPGLLPGQQGSSVVDLITAGAPALDLVRTLEGRAERGELQGNLLAMAHVTLCAPIPQPRKNVFCVGRNYKEHVEEAARARGNAAKLPAHPQYFTK